MCLLNLDHLHLLFELNSEVSDGPLCFSKVCEDLNPVKVALSITDLTRGMRSLKCGQLRTTLWRTKINIPALTKIALKATKRTKTIRESIV